MNAQRSNIAATILAVTALVATALIAAGPEARANAGPTESAQVLMPFDGQWANEFNTAPWEHARISSEDWTLDVFSPDTAVYARIGDRTGSVTMVVSPPESYGCTNAGLMVWVDVFVDDEHLGRFGYHHLTDIAHPAGATFEGATEVLLGRTTASPSSWGGPCWNVSTAAGVHAHLVLDNVTGFTCYARYEKGAALSQDAVIAVMGGLDGQAWGSTPRAECTEAALDAGEPGGVSTDPQDLAESSPFLFHSTPPDAVVSDFHVAVHPTTGQALVAFQQVDAAGNSAAGVQPLDHASRPLGPVRWLEPSQASGQVRVDDLVADHDDGWVAALDDSEGTDAGQRLVVRRLSAQGLAVGPVIDVDEQPSSVGRVARDPSTGDVLVAWTRPESAGSQVMLRRLHGQTLQPRAAPTVLQIAAPGEALVVEDLEVSGAGRIVVLTQSGVIAGAGLVSFERSILRVDGDVIATSTAVQPAGTTLSQSQAAVTTDGDILVVSHLMTSSGATSTLYQRWNAAGGTPVDVVGPQSTARPTVIPSTDGRGDLVFSAPVDGQERVTLAQWNAAGIGTAGVVSAPLHPEATLADLRAARTPIDDSVTLVTRERLLDQIRLTSADLWSGPITVPSAPRAVSVEVDQVPEIGAAAAPGARLTVTWEPPASHGGAPISHYVVRAEPGGHEQLVTPTSLSARVGGLTGDADHTISVTAVNDQGLGAPSSGITVYVPVRPLEGYWMLEADGTVHGFGDAEPLGDAAVTTGATAVALVPLPGGEGYWVLDDTGRVHAFGTAPHLGDLHTEASAASSELEADEVAATMAATPSGDGYWVFTSRGRAMAFGEADHHGDVSHLELNGPIVDSVATPSGQGYYQVGSEGGIFANGDAVYRGSIQQVVDQISPGTAADSWLAAPIVGLVPDPDGDGYWLVATDGGTFSFEAAFRGSVPEVLPGVSLNSPVNGMVAYGDGYLMVADDGGVFTFSDLAFLGSLGGQVLDAPVSAIAPITDRG